MLMTMYRSPVNTRAGNDGGNHRQLEAPWRSPESWSSSNQTGDKVNQPLHPSMNVHNIARNDPRNTFIHINSQYSGEEVGHLQVGTPYRCFEPLFSMHNAYGRVSTTLYSTVCARAIVNNNPSTIFMRQNSLYSGTDSDGNFSTARPKNTWARSPIICIHEKNIWDPEIPLNTPWNRQVKATSFGPYLYNNAPNRGSESAKVLPYTQIMPQSNANRCRTRPVIAFGPPSGRTLNTHASVRQRSPVVNAAPAGSSKKKSKGSKRGRRSRRSHNRNLNHSITQQPQEHECDLTRSLFVKKLPNIRKLKKQLRSLFKRAGFKPTKITRPTQVDRFRDFAFIEFPSTEIANKAKVKMDGIKFGGNIIKVEKADKKKLSGKNKVPKRTRFVQRQIRWD